MKNPKIWYKIKAKKADTAEILIYEQIGEDFWGEGVNAKRFVEDLQALRTVGHKKKARTPGGTVSRASGIIGTGALRLGGRVPVPQRGKVQDAEPAPASGHESRRIHDFDAHGIAFRPGSQDRLVRQGRRVRNVDEAHALVVAGDGRELP